MRKATLRGQVNLQKRYAFAAACYNLSQLLRKKFGCGTLKMALATTWAAFLNYWLSFACSNRAIPPHTASNRPFILWPCPLSLLALSFL